VKSGKKGSEGRRGDGNCTGTEIVGRKGGGGAKKERKIRGCESYLKIGECQLKGVIQGRRLRGPREMKKGGSREKRRRRNVRGYSLRSLCYWIYCGGGPLKKRREKKRLKTIRDLSGETYQDMRLERHSSKEEGEKP